MKEFEDAFFIKKGAVKLVFTKRIVDGKNSKDIKKICDDYGFNFHSLNFNTQVHGTDVRLASSINSICEADGLVTKEQGMPLLIYTADCVPLVFYDNKQRVVALAHAGRRGTFENIGQKTLAKMVDECSCSVENIEVLIGPSISGENYAVSKDIVEKFATLKVENYYSKKANQYYLDLWQVNKVLLQREGVLEKNIEIMNMCTVRDNDKFFSYRLENKTSKRIATIIQLD